MPEILLHHARLPPALSPALEGGWLAALPPCRAVRLGRLREASGRIATLLGIALLIDCARAAGMAPPEPGALRFPARGKPRWPSGPDFSISHAGGRVACALAPPGVRVGLDIEPRHSVARGDLRLVATAAELDDHAAAGLTPTDLFTAKEAVIKAAGADITALARVRLARSSARLEGQRFLLLRPRLAGDCSCTLALSRRTGLAVQSVDADVVLRALA
jgi:phosphopantetheinyl transferase